MSTSILNKTKPRYKFPIIFLFDLIALLVEIYAFKLERN